MPSSRTPDPELLDFRAERRKKALSKTEPSSARAEFLGALKQRHFSETEERLILGALSFLEAARLPEEKAHYRAHPMRVARYLVRYEPDLDAETIAFALVHNLTEVSGVGTAELELRFGGWVARSCARFEVDRVRQKTDAAYLERFYSDLASERRLWLVKIFDKWDNVLSVYYNPSATLRNAYLDEIERWVLPRIGPPDERLGEAFGRLVAETRTVVVE